MKKAKFIINSAITKSEQMSQLESIIGCLILNQLVSSVDVAYTTEDKNALEEAASIRPGEYDFVTAVGGDGTVHDVVNGVIQSGSHTPVAIISTGTANSFANFLDLPKDRIGFCTMVKKMNTAEIQIGKINDRYFMNSVVGGFLTTGVASASQLSKAVFGKMAYVLGAARSYTKDTAKSAMIHYECEEFSQTIDTTVFVVKNVTGHVKKNEDHVQAINDGLLEVMIIEKSGIFDIPALFMKFMQGSTITSEGIKTFTTKAIDITLEEGSAFEVEFDKESYGKLPIHLEPVEDAVRLLVP